VPVAVSSSLDAGGGVQVDAPTASSTARTAVVTSSTPVDTFHHLLPVSLVLLVLLVLLLLSPGTLWYPSVRPFSTSPERSGVLMLISVSLYFVPGTER